MSSARAYWRAMYHVLPEVATLRNNSEIQTCWIFFKGKVSKKVIAYCSKALSYHRYQIRNINKRTPACDIHDLKFPFLKMADESWYKKYFSLAILK